MNYKQAFSWLIQPEVKALMPADRDTKRALEKSMLALKKQIPVKVNVIHVDEYFCPTCGAENNCDDGVIGDMFCPECGQAIYQEN